MKRRKTTDAVEILHKRYVKGSAEMAALLEEERTHAQVAAEIHQMRKKAGLSQRELARKVGTSPSVICRLENADYEGHSLAMLRRIAAALDRRVRISFEPLERVTPTSSS